MPLKRIVTNGRATPPLGFDCERWRRTTRGHLLVATVAVVGALVVCLYVGALVVGVQILSQFDRTPREDLCEKLRNLPSYGECYERRRPQWEGTR